MSTRERYRSATNRAAQWRSIWEGVRRRQSAELVTDQDLADQIGLKLGTVQAWLARGGGRPTTDAMEKWAEDWL